MADGIAGAIGVGLGGIVSLSLLGLVIEKTGDLGDVALGKGDRGLSEDLKVIDID